MVLISPRPQNYFVSMANLFTSLCLSLLGCKMARHLFEETGIQRTVEFCKHRARLLSILPAITNFYLFFPKDTVSLGNKDSVPEIFTVVFINRNSLHMLVTPLPACGFHLDPSFLNSVMMSSVGASSTGYRLRCLLCTQS